MRKYRDSATWQHLAKRRKPTLREQLEEARKRQAHWHEQFKKLEKKALEAEKQLGYSLLCDNCGQSAEMNSNFCETCEVKNGKK